MKITKKYIDEKKRIVNVMLKQVKQGKPLSLKLQKQVLEILLTDLKILYAYRKAINRATDISKQFYEIP